MIRDLDLAPEVVDEAFQDLLHERMRKRGLQLETYVDFLNDDQNMSGVVETLPSPPLTVIVSKDFDSLVFQWEGEELVIDNPTLFGTVTAALLMRDPPRSARFIHIRRAKFSTTFLENTT